MKQSVGSTHERIVDAANRLFYKEGIRAVSVDAVAEKAGITKKTLYYHFRSKDDLIAAYLASRDQPNLTLYAQWFDAAEGGLADKVEAIFLNVARSARHPKWKGCGFLRTAAELANLPGHPAMKIGAAHKKKFEAWLQERFEAEGWSGAETLARKIVLLLDGAFSTMLVHRDPAYAEAAGRAAGTLVRQTGDQSTRLGLSHSEPPPDCRGLQLSNRMEVSEAKRRKNPPPAVRERAVRMVKRKTA